MSSLLSVVVTGREADRLMVETLTRVAAQTLPEIDIVVVGGEGWSDRARRLLEDPLGSRSMRYVHVAGGSPGAMLNAGARVCRGRYIACVERGELLEPRCCALAAAALDADPRLGVVGARETDL